jgi:hypothetical protein
MGRIARVVAAKYPHHVTRRGNRRQDTFFCEDELVRKFKRYLQLMELYDRLLNDLELYIVKQAKGHDVRSFYLLNTTTPVTMVHVG